MNYQEALKQYIDATNSHDFSNVRKVLHPNAIYWFTNKTCTTISEIQNHFETTWNTIKEEIYTAKDVQWITTDLNTATCVYTYHYQGYHNGKFVSGSGRATNIFTKKNDNEWQLIHEHLSSL
ncbi:YybH family protein [Bacillus sp. JJ1562]|uniref:YybH family protein n=1 Tax=Bacillus sp. JJ1562 TaxID=3122960 RepID=UPI003003277E